nr:Mu transposase C-terminal domain-containing protein [uncultured Azospirillum sp.]
MARRFTPKMVFLPAQPVEIRGRRHRYVRRAPDGSAVFEDEQTQEQVRHTDAELAQLLESGQFDVLPWPVVKAPDRAEELAAMRDRVANNDRLHAETARRWRYVRAWLDSGHATYTKGALKGLIERVANDNADPTPPGASTVQRWIKRFREGGRAFEALAPTIHRRGNRTARFGGEVMDLTDQAIDESYLQPGEPPLTFAHNKLLALAANRNASLPEAMKIKIPSARTLYRIRDRRIDQYTLVATRRGKEEADALFQPVGSAPGVDAINRIWEIDHTEVTSFLVCYGPEPDPDRIIGHPWITVALDRHSTMPVGLYVGFEGPSLFTAFECLRNAILPKGYMRENYPQIQNDWPCFGVPGCTVPDNAAEFRSPQFPIACAALGIDVQYTPVGKARFKGKIERFFGTLQTQCRSVTGARFADYYRRVRRPTPETASLVTLEQLEYLLHRWIADVYAVSPRRRFEGRSARDMWENSARIHAIAPPSRERVLTSLSLTEFRVPRKDGITFLGLRYNSTELANLRIAPKAPPEFRIKIDPGDLAAIQVHDDANDRHIRVEVDPEQRDVAVGKTLHQYKVARALVRNNPLRYAGQEDIARAMVEITEYGLKRQGKGTQKERRALAKLTQQPSGRRRQADAPDTPPLPIVDVLLEGMETVGVPGAAPPQADDIELIARRHGLKTDTMRPRDGDDGLE